MSGRDVHSPYVSPIIPSPPVALTIAGSDCSAGAGLQADLKTFQHFGVHGLTAVTCVVSETANVVRAVHAVPTGIVHDQIALLMESFPVGAVKTGMLYSAEIIESVAAALGAWPKVPLVVDPVMVASTGASLLQNDAVKAYRELLLPRATLITPNLPEAEVLTGAAIADENALVEAALQLSRHFETAVLLKGGHLPGPQCIDVLAEDGSVRKFSENRIDLEGSHGTGCTFSAAIAALLACGKSLDDAVGLAKSYLTAALRDSYAFAGVAGRVHALNQGTVRPENLA